MQDDKNPILDQEIEATPEMSKWFDEMYEKEHGEKFFDTKESWWDTFVQRYIILFIVGFVVIVLGIFYAMSVDAYNRGECILIVSRYANSSGKTCDGINSPLENTIYLAVVFVVIGVIGVIVNVANASGKSSKNKTTVKFSLTDKKDTN